MSFFLEVENLEKRHGGLKTLDGVSFGLEEGEILTLLGPSGGGKTTLLRILAGLEAPDAGRVRLSGRDLGAAPAHKRGVGFVFQDAALFPHLSVGANVAFGLRMAGMNRKERELRVQEMLDLVELSGMERRRVHGLSGGERQRVALARSLAPSPELLLLDEPLGALDRNLRERLARDLRRILKKRKLAAIFVTHDQEEAFFLGDRIAVLLAGRLVRVDTPEGLSAHPGSLAVARFLGEPNVFAPEEIPQGLKAFFPDLPEGAGLLVRPEGIVLGMDSENPEKRGGLSERFVSGRGDREGEKTAPSFSARVGERRFFGTFFRVELDLDAGFALTARLPLSVSPPPVGARVCLVMNQVCLLQ